MMPPMSYNEFVIMEKPNPYGPGCTKSTTRLVFKEDLMARSPSAIGDYHHYHHHQQHVAHNHHHHQHNQLHQPGRQFVTKVGSCYLPAPQGAGNCPQRPVSGSGLVTRNNSQLRYMIPTIYAMEKVMQSNQPGQGSPLAASSSSSAGRPMASLVANQANNGLINQSSKSGLNNGHYDEMKQVHQNNNGLNNNKYNSMRKSLQSLTGKVNGSNLYICTPGSNRHHLHHQPNNGQEKLHHHQLQQQSKSDHLYVSINETMAATESPLPQKDGAPLSEGNLDSMATQTTLSAMDDEDDEDQVTGHFSDAETMSLDNVSFTTSANDDFEFHDTRDMDGDLDMKLYESSRSECDLQDTSLDMSIIALTEDFVHSAMSSSESELEEEEKSELVHEKPSQLKTKFAVKRLTTKLSQSSSSKLAEKRPFHSTTDLFKLDLSNCRASQYDKVTGSLTNLTQVGHLHHGDPRAGATNDPKWPPRPGRGYKSPMNTLSEDCESNSTTKTSLDTLKLTGLTDCGLLVNNGQPVKGDPRLDGGGHVNSDMNGCHGSEEEEETSQRQLESELSSKQICKIREAFNKHNLRNSLILRQKALQKKSIKSKLKKVNYTTKSSNDVSKDPKSTANYQQLRGQLANSKASPISRFGLSNIGRIGSYAQDWNRNAISIQPTSKLTSGQRSSSVSLIPTCK
ncbi:hypothetical protein HDE_11703 [Halotydeus destructor]|nr:hypothetical protein HDE_11703 [Halotydeus destructor]